MADQIPRAAGFPLVIDTGHSAGASAALEDEVVQLFDQLRSPVLRYVLGFSLPVQDGEEIVQEVFLALFQHLRAGKSRRNLRGWVFRVAHNLALKRRQAMRRMGAVTPEAMMDGERACADPAPGPEDRLVNAQEHGRVLAVVNALPEPDRRCLHLRAEGLRYREIAGVLDMSLGAVSISLTRSLARIARAVER